MYHKKATLALVLLFGLSQLATSQQYYGVYPEDEGVPQETRRAPGYHPPGYHGPQDPQGVQETQELDDRQTALNNLFSGLLSMIMRFVGPLLSNLGIGASNAVVATMLRKRLALIPEARNYIALSRSKVPAPTARTL